MKLYKILFAAVLPMMSFHLAAQDTSDNTPQGKELTVAATVGYNSFATVKAQPGNLATYEGEALTNTWFDQKLMVGIEGGYFINEKWKLDLGGGLNFTNTPGHAQVLGTADPNLSPEENMGDIPNYGAVANSYSCNYQAYIGGDRYFKVNAVKNLEWFVGIRAGFAYAVNEAKWDDYTTMGKSVGESFNARGSIIWGVEYFLNKAMFVGFTVEPFQYTFSQTSYRPQAGLKALRGQSHNYGVLAAPTLKVGFKFGL